MFNKITIIGVGLIGGSIGLAARQKRLAKEIVGVCRHKESLKRAKRKGAINKGTLNYKDAVKGADLVVLTAPVRQIIKIGKLIVPYVKKGCLITDVGSTKEEIVLAIEAVLRKEVHFVGAHPLAGSEKRGVAFARADLFAGAVCILTRTKRTKLTDLKKITAFWNKIGCRIKIVTVQEHDKIMALVSHLPHLAAAQLIKVAKDGLDFAASGFSDTTRIASSDAEIWSDIFLTNKKFITQALDEYIGRLKLMRNLINKGEKRRLSLEFKTAKALRDNLHKK